jgi:polar amino acid transport system substrate-binding protein
MPATLRERLSGFGRTCRQRRLERSTMHRPTRHRPALSAALLGAALVLTACGGSSSSTATADTPKNGVTLVKAGKLTTCTHLPYAPFQFQKGEKIVGFDVDLVDLIAKKLGVEQTIVDTPFEGIKSGEDLNTGKCDIAAAGMTITPARQQVLQFTTAYFNATQALLAKTGATYKALTDLQGKKLGVQSGTTGKDYVEAHKPAGVKILEFEDLATEQQALATGQIDAAINDLPVWLEYIKENPGKFAVTTQFDTGEQYGFGLKKGGDAKLLQTADDVLAAAKADGTYDSLYEKWFGTKPTQ